MPKAPKKDGVEQIVAKAFAHPLRVQILTILNERIASPNRIARELDRSLNLVAYHVRVLEKYDCIELVETKPRRGATEHFYRATRRQFLTESEWKRLPKSLRPGLAGAMLKSIFDDIEEAVGDGSFDEAEDWHLSRTPMVVDHRAWEEVSALLGGTQQQLLDIQTRASQRLADADERGFSTKVEMLNFRSPRRGGVEEPEQPAQ